MKARIVCSNHTIIIEEYQIDLWYNFTDGKIQIFVDGSLISQGNFHPSFSSFNLINLMDVATTILDHHKKREQLKAKQLENETTV